MRHLMTLRMALLVYVLLLSGTSVHALETHFQHHFTYENSDDAAFVNASQAMKGVAFGGAGSQFTRWNTRTIIAQFGMEAGGRVDIDVQELSHVTGESQHVPLVFTLYNNDQWRVYSVLQLREIPLRSPAILCHYPSCMRFAVMGDLAKQTKKKTRRRVSFVVQKASLYTLQMQVCGDASVQVKYLTCGFVAEKGFARMVNLGYDSRLSEHLGVDQLGLLPLYKVVIFAYTLFSLLWVLECFLRKQNVPKISYAFQVALHAKIIEATLTLWFYRELSLTGTQSAFLDTLRDVFASASSAVLLCVLLFASLGWSLTRDALSRREYRLIFVLFSVYFVIALVKALCDPDANDEICKAYLLTEYVIKSVVMLGVIVALNFTISQLRLALTEARWNHFVTPLTYMKLNQFQRFRVVFLLYLLIPTCLLILNLLVITPPGSWRFEWVNALLSESASLFIYANVGFILRPLDAYIYSRVRLAKVDMCVDNISKGTNISNSSSNSTSEEVDPMETLVAVAMPRAAQSGGAVVRPVASDVIESNRRLLAQYPPPLSPQSLHSESRSSSPMSSPASPSTAVAL